MYPETIQEVSTVVRRERLELSRLVDIDGRGKRGIVGFEQEIGWIRKCGSSMAVLHGGRVLKDCGGFVDVGRWGSSVADGIEEAEKLCRTYSVDRHSTLLVAVEMKVEEIPVLLSPEGPRRCIFGRLEYDAVPKDWMRDDRARIEACLRYQQRQTQDWPEGGFPSLGKVVVEEGALVWSSRMDAGDSAARVAAFMEKWAPPPRQG